MPVMRALPTLGQPDDAQDADAPWADLISGAEDQSDDRSVGGHSVGDAERAG